MNHKTFEAVICGAGIAGLAAAHTLSQRGLRVLVVDERPPLSLTSDKSSECYRNAWPGPGTAMVDLMNASIDQLEHIAVSTANRIRLNRRGYLYVTTQPAGPQALRQAAAEFAALGAGPVREHASPHSGYAPSAPEDFDPALTGADLLLDPALIHHHFPYLPAETSAALHVRRAGWFSAQQLGMWYLEQARAHGAELRLARVTGLHTDGGRISTVVLNEGERVSTPNFINAAGPFVAEVARLLGVRLPVFSELHLKLNFTDTLGAIPRHAPMTILADPQYLPWAEAERAALAEDPATAWLLERFPAGLHFRPDGPATSPVVLMLWDYHRAPVEVRVPPPLDPDFPEVVVRGLTRLVPALRAYLSALPRPYVDGGYYTKTRENRALIGPLPVPGAFVMGAFSGYGLMAAPAAAHLLAAHVLGDPLPSYAPAFSLKRYADPAYQAQLATWTTDGQL